jgi:Ca-activated chloride channel homolog
MRSRCVRLIVRLICCTLVAAAARAVPALAQGMVIARPPICPPRPQCPRGVYCVAPPCNWPVGAEVVRNSSQVHAELADRVLRYEVTETFVNRGARLGEADYLFPLPQGAAFQDLKLSINGELVAGEVLDASQARGVYEEIVRRQRDPGLVEWMGAGLLRARIFPIAPGEEKTVVVRFQTVARREGDALRIDYTRPAPGCRPPTVGCQQPSSQNWPTARSADGEQEHSPESRNVFTLSYRSGDGFGSPYSPTHSLITEHDGDRRTVRIEGDARDITILLPIPHANAAAVTMLPYAPGDGPGFALITIAPPTVHGRPTPRDVTFVLDVSGSMSGRKIEQARSAGRDLLATLTPQDRFRLIDFSTDVHTFRDDYVPATPEHVREAEQYLDELEAEGATNIEGALRRALESADEDGDREAVADARLPIVLFITDGEPTIGEQSPDALVAQASSHLGRTRLFTFGLGADVNTSLLEQLALHGRGTAQFVRPDESVERAVSLVAHRLTDPVITDVVLHADGVRLTDMLPETLVDLFAGQDLVLLARYEGSGPAHLQFSGRTSSGPITWASDVTFPERERANPFVARLWATQRIGYLEAARHKAGPSLELDDELRALGERFGIPTELTSYLVREPSVVLNSQPLGGALGMGQPIPSPTGNINVARQTPAADLPYAGPTRHIEGHIIDAGEHAPIPTAAVIATGTSVGANTRDDGTVSLDVPANATSITVRRIGYVAQTIPLTAGATDYTIALKKDVLSLETQVVSGSATTVASPTPSSGALTMSHEGSLPSSAGSAGARQLPNSVFVDAKVAAAQRAAITLTAADSTATLGGSGGTTGSLRRAGERTFIQRDGVWRDTRFHDGMRVVQVQAFSAAYFALVQAVPDLGPAFAIGDRVLAAGRQIAVEVSPTGATQLSDADVAAVQAGW